jgi:hypothetical protein
MKTVWGNKPPDSRIAAWSLVVAVLIAAIYFGQLRAMLDSNHMNLTALQSIQRAFLFIETPEIVRSLGSQGVESIVFRFVWKNSGTTPTRHMTTHVSSQYFPAGLPREFSFPDWWSLNAEAHINTPVTAGPHGEAGIEAAPIPANEVGALLSRRTRLYFWGWAKYHDIFEGTPEHITKFCMELVGFHGDPLSPSQSGAAIMNNCPVHNCYDDECEKQ